MAASPFTSCSDSPPPATYVLAVVGMAAKRIVSLLASATEMVAGLGLGHHLVGISHECDFPPEILDKPRLTFTHVNAEASSGQIDSQVHSLLASGQALYSIDTATLALLAPDLIITQAQCDVCAVRYADVVAAVAQEPALQAAQVLALNPRNLEEVFADIASVARATGCHDGGASYLQSLHNRVEMVRNIAGGAPASARPRVAFVEWLEPLMLAGNWTPEMIRLAGGENLLTTAGEHSPYGNWQALIEAQPQVAVIGPCGFDLARAISEWNQHQKHPAWQSVPAVRQGRVYAVDGNAYFNRSGPRLVDSLELLAWLIHPELFPEPLGSQGKWWQQLG